MCRAVWNCWWTRLGDPDWNSSVASFYSCDLGWASGWLLLPWGSCISLQFSRKGKFIRRSFPNKNLLSVGAEGKVLPPRLLTTPPFLELVWRAKPQIELSPLKVASPIPRGDEVGHGKVSLNDSFLRGGSEQQEETGEIRGWARILEI